jgi:hypothetical protein
MRLSPKNKDSLHFMETPAAGADGLVGIVNVDISSLEFYENRARDANTIQHLLSLFRDGRDRYDEDANQVPAIVGPTDLEQVLQVSHITRNNLQKSLLDRPRLSDGENYRKLRHFEWQLRPDLAHEFMLRLSPSKRKNLTQVTNHRYFRKPDEGMGTDLDKLVEFRGQWFGFELGNTRKHIATHGDEHMHSGFNRIDTVWDRITLKSLVIRRRLDEKTVRNLQLRAPFASIIDRNYITHEMDNGNLFPAVQDAMTREEIKRTLLEGREIIPSIKSFHENMKYFEIGANIIRTHIFKGKIIKTTLYHSMSSIWKDPGIMNIEFHEGEFQQCRLPNNCKRVDWAYIQVWLAAQREFDNLGPFTPLRGRKKLPLSGSTKEQYAALFLRRVKLLGFSNQHIDDGLARFAQVPNPPRRVSVAAERSYYDGESLKRRWGKPHRAAHNVIKERLFLPQLCEIQIDRNALNPSVMFIQQDFFHTFFGRQLSHIIQTWHFLGLSNMASMVRPLLPMIPLSDNERLGASQEYLTRRLDSPPELAASLAQVIIASESTEIHRGFDYGPPRETVATPNTTTTTELYASPEIVSPEPVQPAPFVSPRIGTLADQLGNIEMSGALVTEEEIREQRDAVQFSEIQERQDLSTDAVSGEIREPHDITQLSVNASPETLLTLSVRRASSELSETRALVDRSENVEMSGALGEQDQTREERESVELLLDSDDWESATLFESDHELGSETDHNLSDSSTIVESPLVDKRYVDDLESPPVRPGCKPLAIQGHRSYLRPRTYVRTTKRRSDVRPSLESQAHRKLQGRRSYLSVNPQNTPRYIQSQGHKKIQGHRSYLSPGSQNKTIHRPKLAPRMKLDTLQGRRSFLVPKTRFKGDQTLCTPARPQQPRSLLVPHQETVFSDVFIGESSNLQSKTAVQDCRELSVPCDKISCQDTQEPIACEFIEFNGMRKLLKSTGNLEAYLQKRKGWIGMIIENRVPRTIRLEHVVLYLAKEGLRRKQAFALVKQPHAESFRSSHFKSPREVEEDILGFTNDRSNKRVRK